MAIHNHPCRSCNRLYECSNIDCRPGTVNFAVRAGVCATCAGGVSLLKTQLDADGLTDVFCTVCGEVGHAPGYNPPCGGVHIEIMQCGTRVEINA